jgi:hypothetical protein
MNGYCCYIAEGANEWKICYKTYRIPFDSLKDVLEPPCTFRSAGACYAKPNHSYKFPSFGTKLAELFIAHNCVLAPT